MTTPAGSSDVDREWAQALLVASRSLVRIDFPLEDGSGLSIATAIAIDRGHFLVHCVHMQDANLAELADLTLHMGDRRYGAVLALFDRQRPAMIVESSDEVPVLATPGRDTASLEPGEPLLALSYEGPRLNATPGRFRGRGQGLPGTAWKGAVIECDFPEQARLYPGDALLDAEGRFVGFLAGGPTFAFPQEVL